SNGAEALAALERAAYDIVLMDIQMPEMGGVEATRVIREREAVTGRHTRIVAMTAHAMAGDRERYMARGMDGYVCKPISPATLFATVEAQAPQERAAATGPAAEPIEFDEMRRRLCNDNELVADVIAMFLADSPERMAEIRAAVAARDQQALRVIAHALKGAAANPSAKPVPGAAAPLAQLTLADTVEPAWAGAAWTRLEHEVSRLTAALRSGIPLRTMERAS